MLTKMKVFSQADNDMYFLKIVADKIIINDNYRGIIILNKDLNVIGRITFDREHSIYASYCNLGGEMLLYCPEDNSIIYIDIRNYSYETIKLDNEIEGLIFSPAYVWNENSIIISTYKSQFVIIDINNFSVKYYESNQIKRRDQNLYKLLDEYNQKQVDIVKVDLKESKIELHDNEIMDIIYPESNYVFVQAEYYEECSLLITMSSNKADIQDSMLITYNVTA